MLAPERTIKSIKRKMGQDVKVKLGDQEYRPQEISAMILRALRDRAARAARRAGQRRRSSPCRPTSTTPSGRRRARPANWPAWKSCASSTSRRPPRSTYDPSQRELRRMLVYDLGGGTFDVSIVQAQEGVVEVLASHGDTQLGGDDFDDLLLKLVCDRFQEEHGIDLRTTCVARARVLRAVEAAKRQLSDHPFARIEEEFIAEKDGQALHLNMEISREEYEKLIRPLLDRTMDCVQRALDDAHLTGSAIDKVVLVGGSTRTPLISAAAGRAARPAGPSGGQPGPVRGDGGGHPGGHHRRRRRRRRAGGHHAALAGHQVPGRAGTASHPFLHRFAPIIHRNTPLPASRSEVFHTVDDRQTEVEIDVYQGEDDDVRRNHRVGRFLVAGAGRGAGRQPDRRAARPEPGRHAEGVGPRDGPPACRSR